MILYASVVLIRTALFLNTDVFNLLNWKHSNFTHWIQKYSVIQLLLLTSAISEIFKLKTTLRWNQVLLNKSFHIWNNVTQPWRRPNSKQSFLFGLQKCLALESKLFSSSVNSITIQTWGGALSTRQLIPKADLSSQVLSRIPRPHPHVKLATISCFKAGGEGTCKQPYPRRPSSAFWTLLLSLSRFSHGPWKPLKIQAVK